MRKTKAQWSTEQRLCDFGDCRQPATKLLGLERVEWRPMCDKHAEMVRQWDKRLRERAL